MRHLFLLSTFVAVFAWQATATHIVGGEIFYSRQGKDTFHITLRLLIDCVNGNPSAISADSIAYIGFFNATTFDFIDVDTIYRNSPKRVEELHYNCVTFTSNACVDEYLYRFTKVLHPGDSGIIISYQRCCRNHTISNIIEPGTVGSTYWTRIPPDTLASVNSSPAFRKLPPNFLCTNAPLIFDHSATDSDGDSLVYSLILPNNGANSFSPQPKVQSKPPYPDIVLLPGYSVSNFMNNQIPMKIDPKTGELRIFPDKTGQFVVGIRVDEYRDGKKIGEIHRDYQFNVQECVFDVQAYFTNPARSCLDSVSFVNQSSTNATYHWDFGDTLSMKDTANTYHVSYQFREPGNYLITLIVNKTECADTFYNYVEVVSADTFNCEFVADKYQACDSMTVKIINNGHNSEERHWKLNGAPLFILGDTFQINLNNPGSFLLELFMTDSSKCNISDDYSDEFFIYSTPSASFTLDTTFCSPYLQISDESPSDAQWWIWNDSVFQDAHTPFTLKMQQPGLQTIWLIQSNGICKDSVKKEVFGVFAKPASDLIQVSPLSGCEPLIVGISATLNADTRYIFESGDGLVLKNKMPETYIYGAGNYRLSVLLTDSTSCRPVDTFIREIKVRAIPKANFNVQGEPCSGELTFIGNETPLDTASVWMVNKVMIQPGNDKWIVTEKGTYRFERIRQTDSICFDTFGFEQSIHWNERSDLGLYNVFTPGEDDNINSDFGPTGLDSACFRVEMFIYNRWGELVFQSDRYRWDGRLSNTWARHPAGVYFVMYRIHDNLGKTEDEWISGTVTLIR